MNLRSQNMCIRNGRNELQISTAKSRINEVLLDLISRANLLKQLANPVRLAIVYLLQQEGQLSVCDISEILEMKVPAISQHLKKLSQGKMVSKMRDGNIMYYTLTPSSNALVNEVLKAI